MVHDQGRETYFTDDGFALGVAYMLAVLKQTKVRVSDAGAHAVVVSSSGERSCRHAGPENCTAIQLLALVGLGWSAARNGAPQVEGVSCPPW